MSDRAPPKAMILAAGRGARMRELTDGLPKPMIPVAGRPLIEYHLMNLARAGVKDVVINLGWHGDRIRDAIGEGRRFGLHVKYSDEGWPALEVGGGIHNALPMLGPAPFVVINGDVFSDFPLARLVERALILPRWARAHLVLVRSPDYYPAGDFTLEGGRVGNEGAVRHTFTGLSVHTPEFFAGCTPGHFPMLPLWRAAVARGEVAGEMHGGQWSDVGTPERLSQLESWLATKRAAP
ncbi:MAG TPA: nucleotidyltransferase family protein [Verrucomicrobiae bacterium]|nr:nucleotidyltransferase family protein [Verrucomicrobiae bacterium]